MREIANRDLSLDDVPPFNADWDQIGEFALSFNGYIECGSFERCAEVANNRRNDTLTELRACLFFEQRRWRHFGYEPDAEDESRHVISTAAPCRFAERRVTKGAGRRESVCCAARPIATNRKTKRSVRFVTILPPVFIAKAFL